MPRYDPDRIQLTTDNAMQIASEALGPLARFLEIARSVCDEDADKIIIMVSIVLRTSLHPDYRSLTPEDVEHGGVELLPGLGVNITSLAASTGIPRETVRRKVRDLAEMGWVVRTERSICYTRQGYLAVAPIRDAIVRLLVRAFEIEEDLLRSARQEQAVQKEARRPSA